MAVSYNSPRICSRPLCSNIPWIFILPLCANSPQISLYPLCANNPHISSCPLCANSPWISSHLLYSHKVQGIGTCGFSPWISIRTLNTYSPRIVTCPLRLCRRLLMGTRSPGHRVYTHPSNTNSPQVTIHPLHPISHQAVIYPLCSLIHQIVVHLLQGWCMSPLGCLRSIMEIGVCSFSHRVYTRAEYLQPSDYHPSTVSLQPLDCCLSAVRWVHTTFWLLFHFPH